MVPNLMPGILSPFAPKSIMHSGDFQKMNLEGEVKAEDHFPGGFHGNQLAAPSLWDA